MKILAGNGRLASISNAKTILESESVFLQVFRTTISEPVIRTAMKTCVSTLVFSFLFLDRRSNRNFLCSRDLSQFDGSTSRSIEDLCSPLQPAKLMLALIRSVHKEREPPSITGSAGQQRRHFNSFYKRQASKVTSFCLMKMKRAKMFSCIKLVNRLANRQC